MTGNCLINAMTKIAMLADRARVGLAEDTDDGDVDCEDNMKAIADLARKVREKASRGVSVEPGVPGGSVVVQLDVPLDLIPWRDEGIDRPGDRLRAVVDIGGTLHHLEAFEITRMQDAEGIFVFEPHTDDVMRLAEAHNMGRPLTTTLEGRDYVLFMSPFCG